MINAWGLRLFGGKKVDYESFGDIATWAQAIGTVGAIVVALWQVRHQDVVRRAEAVRQEERERTQVYSWMTFDNGDEIDSRGWNLNFNNLTALPISVWVVHIKDVAADRTVGSVDVSHFGPVSPGFSSFRLALAAGDVDQPLCELEFADHAGACWRRLSSGPITGIDAVVLNGQVLAGGTTAWFPEGSGR